MKPNQDILSVSELSRRIRQLLEDGIPLVWVEGEISNYKQHSSGHRYFTLKDSDAQIACVMWRTRRKPDFDLCDGISLRVFGNVTVWEKGGRYQLDVQVVMPVGKGDLQAAFEELKNRLNKEGLFDQERKKSLPRFPSAIGIATSPTGAAVRDLIWGFKTRYPPAELYLVPVAVQGQGAAEQIAAAIETFNRLNIVDLIIIGRGGGSLEDLWAFNEEIVVRAIAASMLPVVSAVGHEVDLTLSDLAADVRAPTPTAAAGLVVPDRADLSDILAERSTAFHRSIMRNISLWKERIGAVTRAYGFRRVESRIGEERRRLDEIESRFARGVHQRYRDSMNKLNAVRLQLSALSPDAVLKRGFCIAQQQNEALVRSYSELSIGEEISLRFHTGGAAANILEVWKDDKGK